KGVSAANMAAQALGGQPQAIRTVSRAGSPVAAADGDGYYTPQNVGRFAGVKPEGPGATVGDYLKEFGASAVKAVGSIGQGIGEVAAFAANKITGTEDYEGKNLLDPVAEAIRGTMTPGGKDARAASEVRGDVFKPSTYDLPDTGEGWGMLLASSLGNLAVSIVPVFGQVGKVSQLTKAAEAARAAGDMAKVAQLAKEIAAASRMTKVVGGATNALVTAGAAAEEGRDNVTKSISGQTHEQLLETVPTYAEAFAKSGDEQQARNAVINLSGQLAGLFAAGAGAAGGVINAKVIEDTILKKGVSRMLGRAGGGLAGRTGLGTAAGIATESGQEGLEKTGQNIGENLGQGRPALEDATRDTLGDVIGGGLAGGSVGSVVGAASPREEPPAAATPPATEVQDPTLAAVQQRAAQGNSPLSAAAAAGTAAAPAPTLPTDPLGERITALRQEIDANGVIAALRTEGSPVDASKFVNDLSIARSPSAPMAAREQALERVEFAAAWAASNFPPQPTRDALPADAMQTVESALSDREFTAKLQPTDRQRLLELNAQMRSPQLSDVGRSALVREALGIIGQNQAPAGEAAPSGPGALLTPTGQPTSAAPGDAAGAAPGQPQVAALLAPRPGPAPSEGVTPPPEVTTGEMTPAPAAAPAIDAEASANSAVEAIDRVVNSPLDALRTFDAKDIQLLFALREQLADPETPAETRVAVAEQVSKLLGADVIKPAPAAEAPAAEAPAAETKAPETPPSFAWTPASFAQSIAAGEKMDSPEAVQFYQNNAPAIEQELQALQGAGSAALEAQQTVAGATETALADVAAPEVKTAPAGPGPTVMRKRRAALDQLADLGFDRVERREDGFYFINPSKRQQFKLDGMADAAMARAAAARALNTAAQQAATSNENDKPQPTEAQAKAGQYAKGDINFDGLRIAIENPVGSTRSGTDPQGEKWSVDMTANYGFVRRTQGADGDQVDVYVPPNARPGSPVFVFDQHNEDGSFDEHKAVLGVSTPEQAQRIYDAHFSDGSGPRRRRAVTRMSMDEFKAWVRSPQAKLPGAAVPTGETTVFPASGQPQAPLKVGAPIFVDGTSQPVVADESAMPEQTAPEVKGGGKPMTSKFQAAMLRRVASVFG
ncbi:MAG: hypothetical protein RIS35_2980, partial [Pseudomonadota bacterium]